MDNPIAESQKVEEEEITKQENETETVIVAASISPPPIIDYEAKKLARDAKAKRKDEKTVQQVLKSLDSLKTPEEKLSAMCKKYSELLHENRQLQATVKQTEKNLIMVHRDKEQFRNERSKAVIAKTRMEQLCRELQKLNKAQQEETALKLRVEEEKRKEICFTFQSAFAEMNTLTNQNNEKSAKMREENLDMREKIKSVRERIELTETQLDKVRQQAKLELELAREKLIRVTLELTSEKEALMEDKSQLLMKLAKYHVRVKEHEGTEQFLRKQIQIYEEKFEEFKRDVKKTTESLKNFRPESREMKKKVAKLEKETSLWKQRWEKTNVAVLQMTEIKEKRDAEMVTLNNKLSTLQELCKAFQRERTTLMAQLREKNEGVQVDRKPLADENRKSMKQVENISKDCEKLKDNLSKLEGSLSEAVRDVFRATDYEEETNASTKGNKKMTKKSKNETRKKSNQKKQETSPNLTNDEIEISETANEKIEILNESEKMENLDENKIDTSEVEIAILERHETVLKDIEKVLAEQAILEAKIACVKELGKSITDTDDSKIESSITDTDVSKIESIQVDNKILELSEITEGDSEKPEIAIIDVTEEVEKSPKVEDNNESPIIDERTIKNSEISEKINEKEAELVGATEFEIVHHGSEPNTAICEAKSIAIDDKTESVKSEQIETILESVKIVPSITEVKLETTDLSELKNEGSSNEKGDLPLEEEKNVTKIDTSVIGIEEINMNSSINPVAEINEKTIEA